MAITTQSLTNAINAYSNASKGTSPGIGATNNAGPNTFGNLVKGAIQRAVDINKQGEAASIAAINNTANLSEVVTAVSEAELTLQTVVAVRDKVIDAYKEIIRMPI